MGALISLLGVVMGIKAWTKNRSGDQANQYNAFFNKSDGDLKSSKARRDDYATMVNAYYDLCTQFYLYGWGESFHFAPRAFNESFEASLSRHEHWLAYRLGLKENMKAMDLGCGVGGPMRQIARFTGAHITGINNNANQVQLGNEMNARYNLSDKCNIVKGDFMHLPEEMVGTVDAAYAIEATCHAPDKVGCYKEIFRALKPGGQFAAYEWCITDNYTGSEEEKAIIEGIEHGDGLPPMSKTQEVITALRDVGFEVIEYGDQAKHGDLPWYYPLARTFAWNGFLYSRFGRGVTHYMVRVLEFFRIAPRGCTATSAFLGIAADTLVAGGRRDIFTPMWYFLARKPLQAVN